LKVIGYKFFQGTDIASFLFLQNSWISFCHTKCLMSHWKAATEHEYAVGLLAFVIATHHQVANS